MDLIIYTLIEIDFNLNAVAIFSFIRSTFNLLYYINRFTGLKYFYII